jgi:hypothetical protein
MDSKYAQDDKIRFFFWISNISLSKAQRGATRECQKEEKKTKRQERTQNPQEHRTPKQLPNRPIKTHHPTQQLPNPVLPLMSCACSSPQNPALTRTQQLPN